MEDIITAIPAIAELGITALICLVFGLIIWRMFKMLETKDENFMGAVASFQKDVEKNDKRRAEDADQVEAAVNHLSDLVKFIHSSNGGFVQKYPVHPSEDKPRKRPENGQIISESKS